MCLCDPPRIHWRNFNLPSFLTNLSVSLKYSSQMMRLVR